MTVETSTRWLTEREQETWRAFLQATRLLFARCERELLATSKMTLAHYGVLVLLSEAPEQRMRMSDLAEATQSLPSSLSHAITRMESEGWVERVHCPSDRRQWYATLTAAGLAALEDAAPSHVESVRRNLFDVLSPEQIETLGTISKALLSGLVNLKTEPPSVCIPEIPEDEAFDRSASTSH